MSTWKIASTVFAGGTNQIRAMYGRRVRSRIAMHGLREFPVVGNAQQAFDIQRGMLGFIAHPHPERFDLLIAFPLDQARPPSNIDILTRMGNFKVANINEATFKLQFEVEVP